VRPDGTAGYVFRAGEGTVGAVKAGSAYYFVPDILGLVAVDIRPSLVGHIHSLSIVSGVKVMLSLFKKLMADRQGATAVEYGLIAALISVAAIVAFNSVGSKLSATMSSVAGKLQ
jgi:pilus assembly protein Flp/PilA